MRHRTYSVLSLSLRCWGATILSSTDSVDCSIAYFERHLDSPCSHLIRSHPRHDLICLPARLRAFSWSSMALLPWDDVHCRWGNNTVLQSPATGCCRTCHHGRDPPDSGNLAVTHAYKSFEVRGTNELQGRVRGHLEVISTFEWLPQYVCLACNILFRWQGQRDCGMLTLVPGVYYPSIAQKCATRSCLSSEETCVRDVSLQPFEPLYPRMQI